MHYEVQITKGIIKDENRKEDYAYGIKAVADSGEIYEIYEDIYATEKEAQQLVDLCNKNQVSLLHMKDVIEDMLIK